MNTWWAVTRKRKFSDDHQGGKGEEENSNDGNTSDAELEAAAVSKYRTMYSYTGV